jgi:EAL domain-containing protein (putative c-di-GMP-specific phosphodiesterase class I)
MGVQENSKRPRFTLEEVSGVGPLNLPPISIAFQPIVNVSAQCIVAYEALTRGSDGQSFHDLTVGMDAPTLRHFHRRTAAEAIRRAVDLGLPRMGSALAINILPDLAPDAPDAQFVREAAEFFGLPVDKIVLELTEDHHLGLPELGELLARNKAHGFVTAMDDFGAGYSGLTALVECCPEILKLDRALVSHIDTSDTRQKIVWAFVQICTSLNISLVAEGVETPAEAQMLRQLGIDIMQGYLFSRPAADRFPSLRDCGIVQSVDTFARRQQHDITNIWNRCACIPKRCGCRDAQLPATA